jgi:hypothetical protein
LPIAVAIRIEVEECQNRGHGAPCPYGRGIILILARGARLTVHPHLTSPLKEEENLFLAPFSS